ncbi:Uncharacterised protein [uncultured archaeon]|nr:Uncharacterised protein [uncultured archaeon]
MDVQDAFKATCRVLLRGEVGELSDFEPYLMRYVEKVLPAKSALSGQPLSLSCTEFAPGSKFISHKEMEEYNKRLRSAKLDINSIKDVDSAVSALGEQLYYCGDIITGNSQEVRASDSIADSSHVLSCSEIYNCKFMAYSSILRYCENCFGTSSGGESKYMIQCYEVFQQTRCMETFRAYTSNDCYYSATLENCNDCIFSFNQRAKRNLIGNRPFSPPEFQKLKTKLVDDLRATLADRKALPSIIDLLRD